MQQILAGLYSVIALNNKKVIIPIKALLAFGRVFEFMMTLLKAPH